MKDTNPQITAEVPFGKVSVESNLDIGTAESNVTFCCLAVNSEGNESYIFTSVILGGRFFITPISALLIFLGGKNTSILPA